LFKKVLKKNKIVQSGQSLTLFNYGGRKVRAS